jgi:iron-sulfur cluster assembly protein
MPHAQCPITNYQCPILPHQRHFLRTINRNLSGDLMTVTLTEKAEFRLRTFLLGSTPDNNTVAVATKGVRLSVKDGGCSGYEYAIEITSKPQPDDLVISQGKVLLYVDAKSAPLLEGVVIDFIDGVMESGFKFTNPNATDNCSCGKSFKAGDCTPDGVPCS